MKKLLRRTIWILTLLLLTEVLFRLGVAIIRNDYSVLMYGLKFRNTCLSNQNKFTFYKKYNDYYAFYPNTTFTPTTGFGKNKPIHINNLGLRSPYIGEKTKKRIVNMGGSPVYGMYVDDDNTYSAQLQRLVDYEVINAGLPWFATADLKIILKFVLTLKPDKITFYTACNDATYLAHDYYMKRKLNKFKLWWAWRIFDEVSQYSYIANALKYRTGYRLGTFWFGQIITDKEIREFSNYASLEFKRNLSQLKEICGETQTFFITELYSPVSKYKFYGYTERLNEIQGMTYGEYGKHLKDLKELNFIEAVNYLQHDFNDVIRKMPNVIEFAKDKKIEELLYTFAHLTEEGHKQIADLIAKEVQRY